MSKDKFKLETYLKLKEREKTDAELGLGRAIEALKAEESQLQNLNNELLRMEQERIAKRQEYAEKQMAGAMNAQSMMAAQTWMKKLEEREELINRQYTEQFGKMEQAMTQFNSTKTLLENFIEAWKKQK